MTRAKYAIFLPVRNGATYVREAIGSVIAQTRGDWVLVVLDNASSDGTVDAIAEFDDPRICLYKSTVSLSIWQSWHRVWHLLAEGVIEAQFATIIGHDDRLLPTFLATVDELTLSHPAASLYQTPFDMIDEHGNGIRPCRPIPAIESSADFLAARLWGLRDSVGTGYVFRPADYVAVGGIPDLPLLLHADDVLFARLARLQFKAASRTSQCLYRLHRDSTSHRLTTARIESQIAAIEIYLRILADEFPDFLNNRSGAAALACFLAREVLILRPLATEILLQTSTCQTIHRLEAMYHSVANKVDYRQWLGANFVSRDVYVYSKQLMLLLILLRDKLHLRLQSTV